MTRQITDEFDLVVIGCGIAGCAAAAAAVQQGLSVVMLERAPEEEYGGNSRYTEASIRMKSESEVSDDFEGSLAANAGQNLDPNVLAAVANPYEDWPPMVKSHGLPDPSLISTFSSNAGLTIEWLKSFGIRFDSTKPRHYVVNGEPPKIRPVGGGLALIEALSSYARKHGADILYEHTATELILGERGNVAGVRARNKDGLVSIRGKAVVLASGGFEGNPEMLTRYIGRRAEFIRPVARGGYFNKGDGIRMALAIGAAPAGDYGSYHAEPLDPRSKRYSPVKCYPYGILVNAKGQRFTDEGVGLVNLCYDRTSREIADQPRGVAYTIYDASSAELADFPRTIRTDQPAIEAPDIASLAGKLNIPADDLMQTISLYNAGCVAGNFNSSELDHLATRGIYPAKSNWARPIDRPPFGAYPLFSGICFTFGGLKVNSKAQVVDGDGRPIVGLYAAGETVGLFYQTYTGGTSVLRGAVFGRIAGLAHASASAR